MPAPWLSGICGERTHLDLSRMPFGRAAPTQTPRGPGRCLCLPLSLPLSIFSLLSIDAGWVYMNKTSAGRGGGGGSQTAQPRVRDRKQWRHTAVSVDSPDCAEGGGLLLGRSYWLESTRCKAGSGLGLTQPLDPGAGILFFPLAQQPEALDRLGWAFRVLHVCMTVPLLGPGCQLPRPGFLSPALLKPRMHSYKIRVRCKAPGLWQGRAFY